jgi:flagellar biosynthesis chaperone FliJ
MPVAHALERLLHVRQLEEDQHKLALESALAEVQRLESALHNARNRERAGRERFRQNAPMDDPTERVAALVESEAGHHQSELLKRCIAACEQNLVRLRDAYLARRVERRQVETLIREAEATTSQERARKEQQNLDEQFGTRRHAEASETEHPAGRQSSTRLEMNNCKESPRFLKRN